MRLLPVDWEKRAETLTPEAIDSLRPEEKKPGIHDITCPGSGVPKLLIVTEIGEFFSILNPWPNTPSSD